MRRRKNFSLEINCSIELLKYAFLKTTKTANLFAHSIEVSKK
jgi:hypothetical protein